MSEFINTVDVLGDEVVMDSIIDRSITEFKDDTLETVGEYAFAGCTALETVDLPSVTSFTGNAFRECTSLKSVNFPNLTNPGRDSFMNTAITKLILPAMTEVPRTAFSSMKSLEYIDIGGQATFQQQVFSYCTALKTLILRSEVLCVSQFSNMLGGSTCIELSTGYIYVPRALVDSYKSATNWSTYAAKFRALEDYTVDGTITGALDESKI